MGLDTTHGCWHGAYSAFMRWREELCNAAGLPPLSLMEGYYNPEGAPYRDPIYWAMKGLGSEDGWLADIRKQLPIKWECLKPDALHKLLYHSDCDGEIAAEDCGPIADSLERLIPFLPGGDGGGHIGNWRDKTAQFIKGLRDAASANESVEFH